MRIIRQLNGPEGPECIPTGEPYIIDLGDGKVRARVNCSFEGEGDHGIQYSVDICPSGHTFRSQEKVWDHGNICAARKAVKAFKKRYPVQVSRKNRENPAGFTHATFRGRRQEAMVGAN